MLLCASSLSPRSCVSCRTLESFTVFFFIEVFLLKEIFIQSQQQINIQAEGHTAHKLKPSHLPEGKERKNKKGRTNYINLTFTDTLWSRQLLSIFPFANKCQKCLPVSVKAGRGSFDGASHLFQLKLLHNIYDPSWTWRRRRVSALSFESRLISLSCRFLVSLCVCFPLFSVGSSSSSAVSPPPPPPRCLCSWL